MDTEGYAQLLSARQTQLSLISPPPCNGGGTASFWPDHGGEFVNRDVRAVVKAHNLLDVKTEARHPESNGIIERFNGTVRDETGDAGDAYGRNYLEAEQTIGRLVTHYNHERLHAALGYMQPVEWHRGNPEERRQVRTERLQLARRLLREKNRHLNAAAA